jgi:hypothetical protein
MNSWVRELGNDGGWSVRPVSPEWILDLCRERVGETPVAWAVALAYENAQSLATEIPEFGASDGGMRSTRLGTESSMLHVLLALSDERQSRWFPAEQVQVIQDLVHRRVPRSVLLAGIRFAHSAVAKAYLQACSALAPPEFLVDELQRVSSVVFTVFDELTSQAEVEFAEENDRWAGAASLNRRAIVDAVLRHPVNDVARAERGLDYVLRGREHMAAVTWSEFGTGDLDRLEKTLAGWLRAAGAQSVLTVREGPTTIWGWGAAAPGHRGSPPEDPDLTGIRVAYGTWQHELEGFRASHREARAVEYVMAMCPGFETTAIPYSSVNLLSVLLSDRERAADFAHSELGALAADDARSRELRATVRSYLELRSPKAVAERHFLARGTVNYRLRQAEEVLGRSLEARPTELSVAILLVECLPMLRAVRPSA